MTVNFQTGGIRYSLVTQSPSLREAERAAQDIQPDKKLWPNRAQRSKAVCGLASPEEILERNKRASRKRQRAWRRFQVGRGVQK